MQAPESLEEDEDSGVETLRLSRTNAEIMALRDDKGADLVQVIGHFRDGYCGWG